MLISLDHNVIGSAGFFEGLLSFGVLSVNFRPRRGNEYLLITEASRRSIKVGWNGKIAQAEISDDIWDAAIEQDMSIPSGCLMPGA